MTSHHRICLLSGISGYLTLRVTHLYILPLSVNTHDLHTHDLYNQRTQSVHSYPGTFSCDRDLDHGSREGVHLNLHDLIICYLLYVYPHHAECIETRLVLMYAGIIMHDCT